MTEEIPMLVRIGGSNFTEWRMIIEGEGPWHLQLTSPQGVESESAGDDVFLALRNMRLELAERDMQLCCNGARMDVQPSGLSRSHGGWMVYILHKHLPSTTRDLVPTLGSCPPQLITSVEKQEAYWKQHIQRRGKWTNFANPFWWIYFAAGSRMKPKKRRW